VSSNRILWIWIAAMLLSVCAQAGEITLKKSTFGNWKFATGDSNFVSVGSSCENLSREMAGDSAAISEIGKFNDLTSTSTLLFLGGCALAAYPLYEQISGEWKSGYDKLVGGAVGLVIVSAVIEHSARKHLTNAVNGYNKRKGNSSPPPTAILFPELFQGGTFGLGVAVQF
jgi:hypothetical protein